MQQSFPANQQESSSPVTACLHPARCQWARAEEDESACGQQTPTEGELALLSAISVPLPMECSPQSAMPRCDAVFEYIITSRKALQYTCDGGTAADSMQLVEFRGRQCGYDLIQWETAIILRAEDMEDSSLTGPACDMKKPSQERFKCGEIPFDENLPHGCLHMREPAVFALAKATHEATEGSVTWWTQLEAVKLFDTGMSAMGSPSAISHIFVVSVWQSFPKKPIQTNDKPNCSGRAVCWGSCHRFQSTSVAYWR